jgi:hypothetical protein
MQKIKFSPDFNKKTIKLLQDYKDEISAPQSIEIKAKSEHPKVISVVKAVSLSLAACLLCVFTVTIIIEQNNNEIIPETQNILYTYETNTQTQTTATAPEIIDDIEEYTPFAAPAITGDVGFEPFGMSPVTEKSAANDEKPVTTADAPQTEAVAPQTTAAVQQTIVTEGSTATQKVLEDPSLAADSDGAADDSPAEIASDEPAVADDESVAAVDEAAAEEDAVEPERGAGESADDVLQDDADMPDGDDSEEAETAVAAEKDIFASDVINTEYNPTVLREYEDSLENLKGISGVLIYKDNTQKVITELATYTLLHTVTTAFAAVSAMEPISLYSDRLEFVMTLSDSENTVYTICLYTDAVSILMSKDGVTSLTAANIQNSTYDTLLKEMYIAMSSQSDYELYLALISGK